MIWLGAALAAPVVEVDAGLTWARTGSEIPIVADPPNWSGLQTIVGSSPIGGLALGWRFGAASVGLYGQAFWTPRPREYRNGHLAPLGHVRMAAWYAGGWSRFHFGPELHAGLGLGLCGMRFRTSDSFHIDLDRGPGVSGELGWTHSSGLGLSLRATGHLLRETGPLDTDWAGGELGVRLRWALVP